MREEQLEVHERLGSLLGDGELGFKHLRRATELGSLVARPALMAKSVLGRWSVSFHFLFLGAGASLMP